MQSWSTREVSLIEEALAERLEGALAPGETLRVTGSSAGTLVEARFVLAGGAEGERVELEARVDPARAKVDMETARSIALDALDLVLLEYLESGRRLRFSGVFEERLLDSAPVSVRGERTLPDLEARAEQLLRDAGASDPDPGT